MAVSVLLAAVITSSVVLAAGTPLVASESASRINGAHEATLTAVVNPRGSETKYEFLVARCRTGKHKSCAELEVVASGTLPAGNEHHTVHATAKEVSPHAEYWVVATNASGSTIGESHKLKDARPMLSLGTTVAPTPFGGAAAGSAPVIVSMSVSHVGSHKAKLEAAINPEESKTEYALWFGYGTCQVQKGEELECGGVGIEGVARKATLSASNKADSVRAMLSHLTAACSYEYWVEAINSSGTVDSAHQEFRTTGTRTTPFCEG